MRHTLAVLAALVAARSVAALRIPVPVALRPRPRCAAAAHRPVPQRAPFRGPAAARRQAFLGGDGSGGGGGGGGGPSDLRRVANFAAVAGLTIAFGGPIFNFILVSTVVVPLGILGAGSLFVATQVKSGPCPNCDVELRNLKDVEFACPACSTPIAWTAEKKAFVRTRMQSSTRRNPFSAYQGGNNPGGPDGGASGVDVKDAIDVDVEVVQDD